MNWSLKRQFLYAIGTALVLLVVVGVPLFVFFYESSTCFDGTHNGDEQGIDCGGSCQRLCAFQVANPTIRWARSFEVLPGRWSSVAYIENPNPEAGIKNIGYQFQLLDAQGALIAERTGSTFIVPGIVSPVFESNIDVGQKIPTRTFFEFTEAPVWYKMSPINRLLSIEGRNLKNVETRPRLDATLVNASATEEIHDIEITAVVFGTDGNAIAASETVVDRLSPRADVPIVFTWPRPLPTLFEQCAAPADVMVLLDVSGSMNDDGGEPPQPLFNAKQAASSFVDRLTTQDRSGVVSFATAASFDQPLSFLHRGVRDVIENLSIEPDEENGRTNIGDAVSLAFEELIFSVREDEGPKTRKVIVLLTDGRANAPVSPGGEEYALAQADEAKADGIILYVIGLGDRVNNDFIQNIATSESHAFFAADSTELNGIYRDISSTICERGPAIIDIIPRTPAGLPGR